MLKIMTSVIPAFILSLTAFGSSAAQLPESLMDKDNPGQEYWCQGNDINTTVCSMADVSMTVSLPWFRTCPVQPVKI